MVSQRYAQAMPKIMKKVCQRYAQIIPDIFPIHAQEMPKICQKYTQDMSKVPKVCPTFGREVLCKTLQCCFTIIYFSHWISSSLHTGCQRPASHNNAKFYACAIPVGET